MNQVANEPKPAAGLPQLIPGKTYEGIVIQVFADPRKLPSKPNTPDYYVHKLTIAVAPQFFRIQHDQRPIPMACEYLNTEQQQYDFREGEKVIFFVTNRYKQWANIRVGKREDLMDTEAEIINENSNKMMQQLITSQQPVAPDPIPVRQTNNESLSINRCLHHMIEHYQRKGTFSIGRIWNDAQEVYRAINGYSYEPQPGVQMATIDDCMSFALPYCRQTGTTDPLKVCLIAKDLYSKINGMAFI